jgi:hypothetical protein
MTVPRDFVAPIRRSKEVKAVCAALRALVERGELRGFQEGRLRIGRMPLDIEWPDGRVSRMRIDTEAATLTFSALFTAGVGSPLLREVKALLRAAQVPGREPARVDPARAMLQVTEQGGAVSLSIVVVRGEYEYCTQLLVELARDTLLLAQEHMPVAADYRPAVAGR